MKSAFIEGVLGVQNAFFVIKIGFGLAIILKNRIFSGLLVRSYGLEINE